MFPIRLHRSGLRVSSTIPRGSPGVGERRFPKTNFKHFTKQTLSFASLKSQTQTEALIWKESSAQIEHTIRAVALPGRVVHFVTLSFYMAGWFLDIYVEYLIRVVARLIMRIRSVHWAAAKGTVIHSQSRGGLGCPVTDVTYKYEVSGETCEGVNTKPFIFDRSAKLYAEHFAAGQQVTARVNPQNASKTVLVDKEQPNPWLK